ncbi:VanZ family protein [Bacillus sp. 03113]|uniref:VanZ family protein n=1 Tax=Bacillus sp. 03113 TaxID=2578211 RepID=UPI001141A185|nr:VanZ family protein [Bacillus sp. 03113]
MNHVKKLVWYVLPVIVCAGVIFSFSAQTYQEQDMTPWLKDIGEHPVVHQLSGVKFDYGGKEISIKALGPAHFVEFFIRKGAHFSVYFILGLLTARALLSYVQSKKKAIFVSVLFCFLYACSDEFHQGFTGGRTPLFSDVLIDSAGGLSGTLLFLWVFMKIRTTHRKHVVQKFV